MDIVGFYKCVYIVVTFLVVLGGYFFQIEGYWYIKIRVKERRVNVGFSLLEF